MPANSRASKNVAFIKAGHPKMASEPMKEEMHKGDMKKKKMPKSMHKMPNGKMMKNSKMKKNGKGKKRIYS